MHCHIQKESHISEVPLSISNTDACNGIKATEDYAIVKGQNNGKQRLMISSLHS